MVARKSNFLLYQFCLWLELGYRYRSIFEIVLLRPVYLLYLNIIREEFLDWIQVALQEDTHACLAKWASLLTYIDRPLKTRKLWPIVNWSEA